jgi:hypothetical protein
MFHSVRDPPAFPERFLRAYYKEKLKNNGYKSSSSSVTPL